MDTLPYHYLEPAAKQEARRAAKNYSAAMTSTLSQAKNALQKSFKKISGTHFKMEHESQNGEIRLKDVYGFSGMKNQKYASAVQVYVGNELKYNQEDIITTSTNDSYTGSHVFPPIPGNADTVYIFRVRDHDGKIHDMGTKELGRSRQVQTQEYHRE